MIFFWPVSGKLLSGSIRKNGIRHIPIVSSYCRFCSFESYTRHSTYQTITFPQGSYLFQKNGDGRRRFMIFYCLHYYFISHNITTENIHTESYLSEKSVRCFFDCVCKCVCKWRHRVKYTEGYLSEKSVRCFCDYCVCKWRVQMECTCVPPCS